MLTVEDCIALCGLSEEEVRAIAEHERIPEIAAAELGGYLTRGPGGELCIKSMIRDDILAAQTRGAGDRAVALKLLLRNFVLKHPLCDERTRAALRIPERRQLD